MRVERHNNIYSNTSFAKILLILQAVVNILNCQSFCPTTGEGIFSGVTFWGEVSSLQTDIERHIIKDIVCLQRGNFVPESHAPEDVSRKESLVVQVISRGTLYRKSFSMKIYMPLMAYLLLYRHLTFLLGLAKIFHAQLIVQIFRFLLKFVTQKW